MTATACEGPHTTVVSAVTRSVALCISPPPPPHLPRYAQVSQNRPGWKRHGQLHAPAERRRGCSPSGTDLVRSAVAGLLSTRHRRRLDAEPLKPLKAAGLPTSAGIKTSCSPSGLPTVMLRRNCKGQSSSPPPPPPWLRATDLSPPPCAAE